MSDKSTESGYKPVSLLELGISNGVSPLNIYVYIQTSQLYALFVSAGEKISDDKFSSLRLLNGANLFIESSTKLDRAVANLSRLDPDKVFKSEVLGDEAGAALKDVYMELLQPSANPLSPSDMTMQISKMANAVLAVVAPESGDSKRSILKHLQNLPLMNQAAAITSLGVLCSLANDFKSRTAFQTISLAAMLMDASLVDVPAADLETYHRNRNELPKHILDRIRSHPVKSQQIVADLSVVSEPVKQLILTHHELHNGHGYHRGIRTSTILPLAGVMALAVDIFEQVKGAELRGAPMSLKDAILSLEEWGVDAHERRHSAKHVANLMAFLGIKPASAVRWAA